MGELSPAYSGRSVALVAVLTGAILTGVILLIAACASTPAPSRSLDAARTAIASAEKADAGRYAVPELGDARQKLAMADKAVKHNNMIGAEQLANESRLDAELASIRTETAKATAMQREGDQRAKLSDERDREADTAHTAAMLARDDADMARSDTAEMQKQVDVLTARPRTTVGR